MLGQVAEEIERQHSWEQALVFLEESGIDLDRIPVPADFQPQANTTQRNPGMAFNAIPGFSLLSGAQRCPSCSRFRAPQSSPLRFLVPGRVEPRRGGDAARQSMNVMRDMGKADDAQLAGIQAAVTQLLDAYETFMGGTLVEALCLWREAAQRHHERRARQAEAEVTQLRPVPGG